MIDLTDVPTIRRIMREYNVFAQKKLGQHFLIDKNALANIVETAEIKNNDTILEIGPGLGTLTRALAEKAKKVVTIEKDIEIIKVFRAINFDLENTNIIRGNALMLNSNFLKETLPKSYKLVANLPYYLTSAIIRFFLQNSFRPSMMVIMVQKEVADRIVSIPPKANILGLAVQLYGVPEIVGTVPSNSFWPAPKVNSAILKIVPHHKDLYKMADETKLFRIIKAGFGGKRKKISNSLTGGLSLPADTIKKALNKSKIDTDRRAQTLTIPEWIKLHQNLNI